MLQRSRRNDPAPSYGSGSIKDAFALLLAAGAMLAAVPACAQQGSQPPPFTVPNPPTPAVNNSPNQQTVPAHPNPQIAPDAPLPQTDKSSIDLRSLEPLSKQSAMTPGPSQALQQAADSKALPRTEIPSTVNTRFFHLFGDYHPVTIPELPMRSPMQLGDLVRGGRLYLSLRDAIALAIENNLDVELVRYNLLAADADLARAKGGGNLRGLDYTIQQSSQGVGSLTSPLLVSATSGSPASTNANVTDLSQITQSGSETQQNLSESGASSTYYPGPQVPLFDPAVFADAGYLRRSDEASLTSSTTSTNSTGSSDSSSSAPLDYVSAEVDYQQGFSSGAQLNAFVDNSPQALYARQSQYDPFHATSTSFTLTQPLLRGLGPSVNRRFINIARIDKKISLLLFEQQLLETVYGVSRLYYDLVSLGENVAVKEQSLAAAQPLFEDDQNQEDKGTLAPIELTRVQALLASSRLDLIQARGEYRQQEVILREQLTRRLGDPAANFASIVPTDRIVVPDDSPSLDVAALTEDALANRPDLVQASLQVKAGDIYVKASRNAVKPQLNLYANVQTRGSSLVPYLSPGSPGTGVPTVPAALGEGGLELSTIYQGGVQLTIPLRNRIAQADAVRDTIQVRQAQARTTKLENDVRQQIEDAAIALDTAHQAYAAAVESSNYQQQLLQAELDMFSVGESTNYLIIQDQAYLAQARSTEVAARSDWMKARLTLDKALGNLLEKNNVLLDDAVRGNLH